MPKQRYHIHVCLVRNEQPELENLLQVAFADKYFVTWDLIGESAHKIEYSRQQIEACDYLLFILGDDYGVLAPSGVSYLHLNYVYASTKRHPLFAIVKSQNPNVNYTRQRIDFANLIEREQSQHMSFYSRIPEASTQINLGLEQLIKRYPIVGWTQPPKPPIFSQNDTAILNMAKLEMVAEPAVAPVNTVSAVPTSNPNIVASAAEVPDVPKTNPNPITSLNEMVDNTELLLTDSIMVSYSAQAYQEGNLKDLILTHSFTWTEIIRILSGFSEPFSSESMFKKLNESLKNFALSEAIKVQPKTHAVSRCQINALDFQWIKKQLVANQWILAVADERNRELWQLNREIC